MRTIIISYLEPMHLTRSILFGNRLIILPQLPLKMSLVESAYSDKASASHSALDTVHPLAQYE